MQTMAGEELVAAALREATFDPMVLCRLPASFMQYAGASQVVDEVLKKSPRIIEKLPDEARTVYLSYASVADVEGELLEFVPESLRSGELVRAALRNSKRGGVLPHVPENLLDKSAHGERWVSGLLTTACSAHWRELRHVPQEDRTVTLCLSAWTSALRLGSHEKDLGALFDREMRPHIPDGVLAAMLPHCSAA